MSGIAMWFGLSPAGAQGTPEQRAACENDAMRLCSEFARPHLRMNASFAALAWVADPITTKSRVARNHEPFSTSVQPAIVSASATQ